MTGHPALSPCLTRGECTISEKVLPVLRRMREADGRCVGCGRAILFREFEQVAIPKLGQLPAEVETVPGASVTHCANCGGEVLTDRPHGIGECSRSILPTAVEAAPQYAAQIGPPAAFGAAPFIRNHPAPNGSGSGVEMPADTEDPAIAALRATSAEGLVDAVIQLTHKIHGLLDGGKPDADERAKELRVQRTLVKAEIVRRAS